MPRLLPRAFIGVWAINQALGCIGLVGPPAKVFLSETVLVLGWRYLMGELK